MRVIVDIPYEEYKTLSNMTEKEKVNELSYYERTIANGIPLPKGHGDLIDRTSILDEVALTPVAERNFNSCVECVECLPAIIKADNEEG